MGGGDGKVSCGDSLSVVLRASTTAVSRATSPSGGSGDSPVPSRSSCISSSGIALPSGCALIGCETAPVSSGLVAGPLRLGVARRLRCSIGPRLPSVLPDTGGAVATPRRSAPHALASHPLDRRGAACVTVPCRAAREQGTAPPAPRHVAYKCREASGSTISPGVDCLSCSA